MAEKTIESKINFDRKNMSDALLRELYKLLKRPRMVEKKMLSLLRQGKISKWFSGIGQEAISVGVTAALYEDEFIFPMHRNLGVFTTRKIPLHRLFCQWQGKPGGFTNGRDRSFHFGAPDYNIVGMISHLGPQLSLATGVALANKMEKSERISVAFSGEGGTSEGEFHEALNVAAVWQSPVIFIVENNGYGLSTPVSEQFRCKDIADRAIGYGMDSVIIDGNNILEVYHTIKNIAEDIRKNPRPFLVECKTFRQRGHEEASGTKYVPQDLMDAWIAKDPITNFEAFLLNENVLEKDQIKAIEKGFKQEIESELKVADDFPEVEVNLEKELENVFAPVPKGDFLPGKKTKKIRFIDGITEGLHESMKAHDRLVLMGQDIADYGGVFKITNGFLEEFGKDRVRNTPLCESAILGIGLGMTLQNYKVMVEMQFADFVSCGMTQIANNMAKLHYRWAHATDMVVRMPTGAGVAAGPFHSQSNEAWFTHTAGLKVVYPSNPKDAKGLLIAAINDPNPVLFFEHKALYRSLEGEVPVGYYETPIGQAAIVREGSDATIITYGMGVHWALELVGNLGESVEIIDLRTLSPIDYDTIADSVKKTNRVLVLHEDCHSGGIGGDISSYIGEHLFQHLDAPIVRVSSLDTPIPFHKELEKQYLASHRFEQKLLDLLAF